MGVGSAEPQHCEVGIHVHKGLWRTSSLETPWSSRMRGLWQDPGKPPCSTTLSLMGKGWRALRAGGLQGSDGSGGQHPQVQVVLLTVPRCLG